MLRLPFNPVHRFISSPWVPRFSQPSGLASLDSAFTSRGLLKTPSMSSPVATRFSPPREGHMTLLRPNGANETRFQLILMGSRFFSFHWKCVSPTRTRREKACGRAEQDAEPRNGGTWGGREKKWRKREQESRGRILITSFPEAQVRASSDWQLIKLPELPGL